MFPFGTVARCLGYLNHNQIREALTVQELEASAGDLPRKIGEILIEIGSLSERQVETILVRQTTVNHRFTLFNQYCARRREFVERQADSRSIDRPVRRCVTYGHLQSAK